MVQQFHHYLRKASLKQQELDVKQTRVQSPSSLEDFPNMD